MIVLKGKSRPEEKFDQHSLSCWVCRRWVGMRISGKIFVMHVIKCLMKVDVQVSIKGKMY